MPRTVNARAPMPNSRRAKQFMSFDALHGLKEAIAAAEHPTEQRRYLSEESIAKIDQQLQQLQKGQIATVLYYGFYEEQYLQITGPVTKVNPYWKTLQIGDVSISFSEIYEIIPQ